METKVKHRREGEVGLNTEEGVQLDRKYKERRKLIFTAGFMIVVHSTLFCYLHGCHGSLNNQI